MRVLITDCRAPADRGQAAVLDAVVAGLCLQGAQVEVVSDFPELVGQFHGIAAVDGRDLRGVALAIARADLVVSCGGDLGDGGRDADLGSRLATLHAARRIGVPYVLFGRSIGPFLAPLSRQAAREVLDGAAWICVRDEASAGVLRELGVAAPLRVGVDAAVLGRSTAAARSLGPALGVAVRGDHFSGCSDAEGRQSAYEDAITEACDAWVRHTGGIVRLFSTCTSVGGYPQDDRVAARRVGARMEAEAEVMEAIDLDFAALRGECGACDLFVGTPMHALLFATTACVPSVGFACDGPARAWMRSIGLGDRVVDASEGNGLTRKVLATWDDRHRVGDALSRRVDAVVQTAREDMDGLVRVAAGEVPERAVVRERGKQGWEGETWRYDQAHRRLRMVADIVMGEGGERVLDLGSSTGMLGRMLGPAFDYTGIDMARSVAADEPRFRVRTGRLDEFVPNKRYDVVVASGSLEYVEDLEGVLAAIRASLATGGLAVLTLFNLAHISRSLGHAPRHPAWTLEARPDDVVLALHEAGLKVQRIVSSTVGYGPAAAEGDDRPTDCEIDGVGQMPPERLLRLGHHWVFVCRAGESQAGPRRLGAELDAGHFPEALQIAASLVKLFPWSARAWSDLACAWHAVGREDRVVDALGRAWRLDPARPDVVANLAALQIAVPDPDPEQAVIADPGNAAAWAGLIEALTARGQIASARLVASLRRELGVMAAK